MLGPWVCHSKADGFRGHQTPHPGQVWVTQPAPTPQDTGWGVGDDPPAFIMVDPPGVRTGVEDMRVSAPDTEWRNMESETRPQNLLKNVPL